MRYSRFIYWMDAAPLNLVAVLLNQACCLVNRWSLMGPHPELYISDRDQVMLGGTELHVT